MTLIEYRKQKKLTQGQLAELLGVHWTTIARWEAGVRKPSLDVMSRIESVTRGQVRMRDFLEETA